MGAERRGVLVIGLGNSLAGDDGIGPAALALLARSGRAPPGVELVDGGTLGLRLLPLLAGASAAILVDAVRLDAPAGTLVRLTAEDLARSVPPRLSSHELGVLDLLGAARLAGTLPPRLVVLGVVPARIAWGEPLSAEAASALPALVQRILEEANAAA